eukprot:CAMPEP_0114667064 /NCGR_PEP_ID=MMETSP0191-20121206/33692_1 /TAXON_ID=126664 /ORGANISM="Sorites sp." /LENGTH=285 /DNA_ID=CAMNT_0001916349 /DNA_START=1 /DNA_END=858 /DNA_ORIENTATION=-
MSQVQVPPGFEASCRQAVCSDAAGATSLDPAEELKAELIKQVTEACKEHVNQKTQEAVETLWKRGQKAIQSMQQQHAETTEQLRSQLAACTESHRSLERETVVLRANLEAMMKHLTILFGVPPHCEPESLWNFDNKDAETLCSEDDLHDIEGPTPQMCFANDTEMLNGQGPVAGSGGTGSESAPSPTADAFAAGFAHPTAATFSLMLRRADNVPVGLHVQGDDGLLVEKILPGGAIEAWNKQCPGEMREIRPGDRIIMINGHEDPEAMRHECLTKLLLKMTVQRV